MEMKKRARGHPAVGWASMLLVLAAVLLLAREGCEASRYCSYHPEAPECRGKQLQPQQPQRPRPHDLPPVGDDYDDLDDYDWEALQDERLAAISANAAGDLVIDSWTAAATSGAAASGEAAPATKEEGEGEVQLEPLGLHEAGVALPPKTTKTTTDEAGAGADADARPPLQPAAQGWRELLRTRQVRTVAEALSVVGAALVMFAVLARWSIRRQARRIDALDDVAAGEALLARSVASPFAVVVDAALGTSLVADLDRRLEAKLVELHAQRERTLDARARDLAEQVDAADRKHQFAKRWRRTHAKTLPIPQLEALLAEAEEAESEFEVVIREWLEFRRQIERESSTLRITMGEDGESLASSLSQSTELSLLAAARPHIVGRYDERDGDDDSEDDGDDTVVIEREPQYKEEAEAEEEESEDLARSVAMRGERNAAKRRSTKGPLGARVLEDYGGDNDSSIARELARQTDSESYFRVWELRHKQQLLQLGREKLRQKQEDKIQEQQQREEENEEKRNQARRALKEQQETNRIQQEKLNHQKQEAQRVVEEAERRNAWSSLGTKLAMHASIYGGIALYHLWHSLLDSWRSALDLSSTCTPAVPPFVSAICLPDLTAYLPLHVLLPLCFCMIFLAVRWGGLFFQLPAFAALGFLLVAIWSKIPSALDIAVLAGVVAAHLLVFAAQRLLAWWTSKARSAGDEPRSTLRLFSVLLSVIEVSLFVVNVGLALACFARRRDDLLHDSFTDCFATPSDFGSCYTYY